MQKKKKHHEHEKVIENSERNNDDDTHDTFNQIVQSISSYKDFEKRRRKDRLNS